MPENVSNQNIVVANDDDVIGQALAGNAHAFTTLIGTAMDRVDSHDGWHVSTIQSLDVLEELLSELEDVYATLLAKKIPQPRTVSVSQTKDVGFTITIDGKQIPGSKAAVMLRSPRPGYVYYNEATKRWRVVEFSTSTTHTAGDKVSFVPAGSYELTVFILTEGWFRRNA